MGLMKKLNYANKIYVSKDGMRYTDKPNAYMFSAA